MYSKLVFYTEIIHINVTFRKLVVFRKRSQHINYKTVQKSSIFLFLYALMLLNLAGLYPEAKN